MVDVRLFFGGPRREQHAQLLEKCKEHISLSRALLHGPSCQKTSLLFQYAYNEAQQNHKVVYFGKRQKLDAQPPVFSEGLVTDNQVLHRINIKYIEDHRSLKSYLAHVHLLPASDIPHLLLVDDLSCLILPGRERHDRTSSVAGTLAFLQDAADFLSTALQSVHPGAQCKVIVADQPVQEQLLSIYQRWLPLVLSVKGTNPYELNCPWGSLHYSSLGDSIRLEDVHYSAPRSVWET
mmetsp:Transcript_10222/g.16747  ORF Transcript_10222/g.16747 Transcript_10222/m.16747 type:complete len:236 (+) Transcript_10222:43-750(+)